jgi:GxxExxY protein
LAAHIRFLTNSPASVENLIKAHEVQLVNYLNGLKKEIGLLINFSPNGAEFKRKYKSNNPEK